jgi:type VII secretion-associated serine protease mycosin
MSMAGPSRTLLVGLVASCAALTACLPAPPPAAPPAKAPRTTSPPTTAPPVGSGSITGACATGASGTSAASASGTGAASASGTSVSSQGASGAAASSAAPTEPPSDPLLPAEAADQARSAAADAIADPTLAGRHGNVPVVVTSVDADGHPDITTLDTTGPADAAHDAAVLATEVRHDGGDVLAVEADPLVKVTGDTATDPGTTASARTGEQTALATATDPKRPSQWAFDSVPFEAAWDQTTGAGVCVAVLDTGIATTHPEFAGRIGGTLDLSGDGVEDGYGHGTHVAGIIAADANNGVGVAGAAPGATLLVVKVLANDGWGQSSWVAQGITWAVDHGARVINMSLGSACPQSAPSGCDSTAMQTAVTYAQNHDVVVVAAAGNEGDPLDHYPDRTNPEYGYWSWPAALSWPIAVAAVDSSSNRPAFSTQASYVDVAAPGASILSTAPVAPTTVWTSGTTGYGTMSGTSMATPYVSALVALLRSAHPTESATQIRSRVTSTAHDLGTTGWDEAFGAGLIDPVASLAG